MTTAAEEGQHVTSQTTKGNSRSKRNGKELKTLEPVGKFLKVINFQLFFRLLKLNIYLRSKAVAFDQFV